MIDLSFVNSKELDPILNRFIFGRKLISVDKYYIKLGFIYPVHNMNQDWHLEIFSTLNINYSNII